MVPVHRCVSSSTRFRSTRFDASMFVYHQGNTTAYLLLYVDDIILTATTTTLLRQLTDRLHAEFALKDLGPLHYFLGIEVVRRADGFFLHQRKYARELLDRAGMLNCKPAATPVDTKTKLSTTDGGPGYCVLPVHCWCSPVPHSHQAGVAVCCLAGVPPYACSS